MKFLTKSMSIIYKTQGITFTQRANLIQRVSNCTIFCQLNIHAIRNAVLFCRIFIVNRIQQEN